MPDEERLIQRSINFFNAWFVGLDRERNNLLTSNRFQVLSVCVVLLLVLSLNLFFSLVPKHPLSLLLQPHAGALAVFSIGLLILLTWLIWRNLLDPLLRLCNWADLMRGVHLEAKVEMRPNSDFSELASDINMLGNMINQLSRDTEVQLQKHTDYISRESRSLAILYEVASSINFSADLNELFEKSLQSLCSNMNARAGIIRHLYTGNSQEIAASQGEFTHTFLSSVDRFLPVSYPPVTEFDGLNEIKVNSIDADTIFTPESNPDGEVLTALSVPVRHQDDTPGVIHLFFTGDNELDLENYNYLLVSIGQNLGSAVERFRLMEEENELVIMQERTRLSHELHDSLAQTIASLRIQIRVIDETFHTQDEKSIWQQMERIEYTIDQANDQLRELIEHFRVPIHSRGLIPAIEETVRQTREMMNIPIYLQNEWPAQGFSAEIELNVLRIAQECLANIRKHSEANVVRVLLSQRNDLYTILIEDDGIGFKESDITSERGHHLGLGILRDRANQIGADIDIESEPGDGTRIILEFNLCNSGSVLNPSNLDP